MAIDLKRVGLFGGTFDPLHFGHLNLAFELLENGRLDEIWFIPTSQSPCKLDQLPCPAHHRLKMTELATAPVPNFHVIDHEILQKGPSFTIDTVEFLLKKYGATRHFFLLLADDCLHSFRQWKEFKKLITTIPFLVGRRSSYDPQEDFQSLGLTPEEQKRIMEGFVQSARFEISSTQVRERLKKRVSCIHLIPEKVLDYIYENQLY